MSPRLIGLSLMLLMPFASAHAEDQRRAEGMWRQEFVTGGHAECVAKQRASEENRDVSTEEIHQYCICALVQLLNAYTRPELEALGSTLASSEMKEKLEQVAAPCVEQIVFGRTLKPPSP